MSSSDTSVDAMLSVSSKNLQAAIDCVGEDHGGHALVLKNGVRATIPQLETAVRLCRENTCRIDYPRSMRSESERPAAIHADHQTEADALVLEIGLLPSKRYIIETDGTVRDA